MTSSYVMVEQTFNKSKGKALGLISLGISCGISTMAPLVDVTNGYFGAMLILSGVITNSFLVPFLLHVKVSEKVGFQKQNSVLPKYGTTGSTYLSRDIEKSLKSQANITVDIPSLSTQRSRLKY